MGINVSGSGKFTGLFDRLKKSFLANKTLKKILSVVVGVILIFLFGLVINFSLPVLIALPWMLSLIAVFFPIVDKAVRKNITEHLLNCLRGVILGPLIVAGMCAPVRAVFVAIHISTNPIIDDFCPWVLPWYDVGIGALGTIFGILGGFVFVFQTLRQSRLIENLPTSKARSAALGLAEFQGVARPVEDRSLFKEKIENEASFMETWDGAPKDRIVLLGKWWVRDNEGVSPASQKASSRFYLEDDSGRILVDPTGVDIGGPGGGEVQSIILSKHHTRVFHQDHTGSVWTLMPGDPVYLIGSVEVNEEAPPDATGSDRLIVRPSSRVSQTHFLRRLILGSAKWLSAKDVQDIFLLTDTHEIEASSILKKSVRSWIILAIFFTASSFWLFLYSAPWL